MKFICKRNRTTKNKKKGFTLIELMAVIAIVAILAAAFLPKITGYFDEAKKVAVLNEAKDIVTAFESVRAKNSSIKATDTDISELDALTDLFDSTDITKIPLDTSIETCIEILDTETNSFTIVDGRFGALITP